MSHRSTGATLTAASAHHSPAADSANGNRASPGGAIQSTPVSGSTGSSAARPGGAESNDTASGGGEFQRLLTHVSASAQGKNEKAPASDTDASGVKKHDRASDSKKSQPTPSPSGPQAPGQGVLSPVAAMPVPAGRSTPDRSQGTRTDASSVAGPTAASESSLASSVKAARSKAVADSSSATISGTDSESGTGRVANVEPRARSNAKLDDARSKPNEPQPGTGHSNVTRDPQRTPAGPETSQAAEHDSRARADAASAAAVASPNIASAVDTRSLSRASAAANAATSAEMPTDATASSAARSAGTHSESTHRTQDGRELPAQMPLTPTSNTSTHATLNAPVGTAAWSDQLGTHLTWMLHHKVDTATLHVSPAGLGPIEARIALHGGTASVWFGASHPDTRAALEQALPRLRAMFAMQGLSLTDTGVSREAPHRRPPAASSSVSALSSIKPLAQPDAVSETSAVDRGLVDLYA